MTDLMRQMATLLRAQQPQAPTTPADDTAYRMWLLTNKVSESPDYDMRGFYNGLRAGDPAAASSINPNDQQMHFPDKWKLPNHATFSTDSQYYDPTKMKNTPTWQGGELPGGGASWALRAPGGQVVAAEAPWYTGGLRKGMP